MRMPRESCQVEKLHEKLAGKLLPHAGKPSTRKNRKETKKNGHTTFSLFPPSLFYFGLFFFPFLPLAWKRIAKENKIFRVNGNGNGNIGLHLSNGQMMLFFACLLVFAIIM